MTLGYGLGATSNQYDGVGRNTFVISNAGIIKVGPVQSTTVADYETAVATMALAPVRLALAALPVMQAQGHGRIVTITSLGGKLGVASLDAAHRFGVTTSTIA